MNRRVFFHPGAVFLCLVAAGSAWCQNDTVIEFVQDAAWCWFQDERAIVDTVKEKLVIGSTNVGGGVDVTIYDLKTKKNESKKAFAKLNGPDDHNAPGLIIAPDGNYVAMWADHYDKYFTHYSIYNGQQWTPETTFDWEQIPGGTNYTIAYSNVYYLSAEKRMFVFARANERAPNFLYSDDSGKTWNFGGQITTNNSVFYNKGYYKYWSNGVDRIDMVFTEQHPRDTTTSIYHGYITGGKTYSSNGTLADSNIYDRAQMPTFESFTKVFANGTKVNGLTMGRCWQSDVMRYNDGTVAILFEARANDSISDHRNFYARYDGTKWTITYIGKAGGPMYPAEQDYTGLGAISPDDPNKIYVSSPYNPGNDASVPKKREIWRGTTTDNGATWKWDPVTANSTVDNFRPIVPKWKPGKEALLWFRGTYQTAQIFTTNVVGILTNGGTTGITNQSHPSSSAVSILPGASKSGRITVQYSVAQNSPVSLQLFSATGKPMTQLAHATVGADTHTAVFNIGYPPSGLYFCKMNTGSQSQVIPVSIVQ